LTVADKKALDEASKRIDEIRAARAEGWIQLHVTREGRVASIETRKIEALQVGD
jgi:hypothetical protein